MSDFRGLRIAEVTGPNIYGGVSVCVLPLCRHLAEIGADVTMQINDERAAAPFLAAGIKVEQVGGLVRPIRPLRDVAGILRLARWMKARRFDVVHTHTSKGGFMGRLAAALAKVPVVIHTAHGLPFHEYSHPVKIRTYSLLKRFAARRCDRIISVSREHAEWIVRLGIAPAEKVTVIRNGVPVGQQPDEEVRAQARVGLGVGGEVPLLCCVGRLVSQKNYGDLLRAMVPLAARFRDVKALIAGDGPQHRELTELAQRLGVGDSVAFLGFRSDVPDLLAAADVVPLPSLWEGMPLSLLEAMAAARPVVANAIMGVREVIDSGTNGILVPPRCPEALATGVAGLLAEPAQAAAIGRNARRLVEAEFSVGRFLAQHEDLYGQLIAAKVR